MKKEKLLWLVLIVMIVLNLTTLSFLLLGDRKEPRGNKRFDMLIHEELELDKKQTELFEQMKLDHHLQMMQMDQQMKSSFEAYFTLLLDEETDSSKKDSLELILSNAYREKLNITLLHFNELKSICTPEQKKKFRTLIPSLMQVISNPPKKNDPPRRN